jgi:ATP-dependent exoDNAse (exonuclease V) beta subunit
MSDSLPFDQGQREAALNPSKSFIVEAPAGSGKTSLLIQRFLVLLANARDPEEILAITFTRKAANEMRSRIINSLLAALNDIPVDPHKVKVWQLAKRVLQQDEKHGWNLLQNPNRLRIGTIDSFCTNLATKIQIPDGIGNDFQILDDTESFLCLRRAARDLLNDEIPDSGYANALTNLMLHLDNDWQKVELLLASILKRRDQWAPYLFYHQDIDELRLFLEQGLANINYENTIAIKNNIDESLLRELLVLAQNYDPEIIAKSELQQYQILSNLLLNNQLKWREKIDATLGFPAHLQDEKNRLKKILQQLKTNEPLRESLTVLRINLPTKYSEQQWQILKSMIMLLKILVSYYLPQVFKEIGAYDHIEIAMIADRALGVEDNPTDLLLQLDYKIQHILVDEFQDISINQYRLLEKLTAGWQPHDNRSVFLVGDPMQSIYKFRDAKVGLFLRTKRYGINNLPLDTLTLNTNFRASSFLVDWINETFRKVFPQTEHIGYGAVKFIPATAFSAKENSSVEILNLPQDDELAEANKVVEIIKCERKDPNISVAVLVRSRNHLQEIVRVLQREQIVYSAVELETMADNLVIRDLLTLTKALHNLWDKTAWLSVLRAPWCGLRLRDLHALANFDVDLPLWYALTKFNEVANLSDDAKNRLSKIVPILEIGLARRQQMNLRSWIENCWLDLQGDFCVRSANELDYAKTFFELLEKFDRGGLIENLFVFEEYLNNLRISSNKNSEINGVQIMTIHKAKGLEFDVVIFPGLSRSVSGNERELLMWSDRPSSLANEESDLILAALSSSAEHNDPIYEYLQYEDKKKQYFENNRLLYVAMTRAKKRLYLLACKGNEKPKTNSLLAQLDFLFPLEPSSSSSFDALCKADAALCHSHESGNLSENSDVNNYLHRFANEFLPQVDFVALNKETKPISIPSYQNQNAQKFGTAVHEYLRYLDLVKFTKIEKNELLTIFRNKLLQAGIIDELDLYIAKFYTAMQNIVADERGKWILSPHEEAHNEYAISVTTKTGQINHLILDRTFVDNGIRWIIDYKTGEVDNLEEQKAIYRDQLKEYADALQKLNPNLPIRLGLYFPLSCEWVEL